MDRAVQQEISKMLGDPGWKKYNTWTYWSDFALATGTTIAGPYGLFGASQVGGGQTANATNIQTAGVFAPGLERFILTSINMLVEFPATATAAATAATLATMADNIRLVRNALSLQIQTTGSVTVLDVPCDALPAGPEPLGFISTGGVVSNGAGVQDAFPYYLTFASTTTTQVQLVNRLATMPATTIASRVLVRFNGIRLVTQSKMGQGS
jgi:hypothetical protein